MLGMKLIYIRNVSRRYNNFIEICIKVLRKSYPFEVITKDGIKFEILNLHDLIWLANSDVYKYCDIDGDTLTVKTGDRMAKFEGWRYNGDINGVFVKESYKLLPIKDNIILDVGANIGDSAVYFAQHGAKRIISLEPVKANYDIAKKNLELNHVNNVDLLLGGLAAKSGVMRIADMTSNGPVTESKTGNEVKLYSLKDLMSEYDIESSVLKLDCEGCEYDVLMKTEPEILKKFSVIFSDLHDDFAKMEQMKKRLESIGFDVKYADTNWKSKLPEFIMATNPHKMIH